MPFGVAHLRGNGMMQSASQTIALLAPDLHNGAGEREASAKAIAALIAQLLDDAPQRAGTKLALQIERTNEADKARQLSGNGIDLRKVPGHAKDPVLRADRDKAASDAVATIDYTTAMLGILQTSPDWPAAQAKFRPLAAGLHAVQPQNALIDTLLGLEKVAHDDYHTTTERRLAATALAIRWYASDHDGKRPGALKDLVPKYLPDVPLDPMADAKPLQYKNDDQHAIIYSAGDDGRDDGGADRAGPAPKKNLTGWQAFDYVVHLDRQPRQTTPQK
jgi:hypothetical protein